MIFPKKLENGDNVFLLCLSSSMNVDNIEKCIVAIKNMGFNPIIGKSLYSNIGGYMAGSINTRINDLHEAFSRNDIKGVFCVRGGFSSVQLLDKIDYNLIKNNPKVFVGYSDTTNLNIAFNQRCNFGTYHGPMVESNMINDWCDYTEKDFFCAINSKSWEYKAPNDTFLSILENKNNNCKIEKNTNISGLITGGNLSLITSTLGTKYEIDTKRKILFIEDISEEVGRLDRMLYHLKLSGKFDDCIAVIFGNFDDCNNRYDSNYDFYSMIYDFFDNYENFDKPIIYGFESGHAKPYLATVPLGAKCTISINDINKKENEHNTDKDTKKTKINIYFEKEEML